MAQHNILGQQGEDAACYYLLDHDIHILERNWHGHDCEVDIIAEDYGEIIFIEVKTRSTLDNGLPEDAVDAYRMNRLSSAAREYLYRNNLEQNPFRFDIIALDGAPPAFSIRHIVNAFLMKEKKRRHP